ncbi:MAG: DUF58 domain-containing protein [Treponema sp.]|jgi:uncharacterized protein (DUF58 family)|nr:DUF58 domain-containing protein [Treponema sp.]
MDTHELLSKITRLPIVTDSLSVDMLSGNFRSVFKGQGLEFDEARHYQWGDDAKAIDWNASVRLGTPFVKMFREERELTILLLLDTSASMNSGTANIWGKAQGMNPYEQALLVAALIAFSAERGGQRVGALLFDREIARVFPPRKGRRNVLAFVSGALQCHRPGGASRHLPWQKPQRDGQSSNLRSAIAGASRLLKRRSMVVLISDFLSVGWEQELADLGRRHDVIAVRVNDPADGELPDLGLLAIEDPETGLRLAAPTSSASFRDAWLVWHKERADLWLNLCRRAGVASLDLPVDADAAAELRRFFGGRGRR